MGEGKKDLRSHLDHIMVHRVVVTTAQGHSRSLSSSSYGNGIMTTAVSSGTGRSSNDGNAHSEPESEEMILSRIAALRKQERGPYRRTDYLARDVSFSNDDDGSSKGICGKTRHYHSDTEVEVVASTIESTAGSGSPRTIARSDSSAEPSCDSSTSSTSTSSTSSSSSSLNDGSLPIDEECRMVMISWYHQVLDHCSFSRENGGIAAFLLDMYLSTEKLGMEAQVDRKQFQLVSMTALFLAIKMNECETITRKYM